MFPSVAKQNLSKNVYHEKIRSVVQQIMMWQAHFTVVKLGNSEDMIKPALRRRPKFLISRNQLGSCFLNTETNFL